MSDPIQFELWLETETGDPIDQPANRPHKNFCSTIVTLSDGRRYSLNVWTFDFLPLARRPLARESDTEAPLADHVFPPDLLVKSLDRPTMEKIFTELITTDQMKDEWLI